MILVAGRLVLGPQFKFLSTTQPELGMHSPVPGADSLLGLLAYLQGYTWSLRDRWRYDLCGIQMVHVGSPERKKACLSCYS